MASPPSPLHRPSEPDNFNLSLEHTTPPSTTPDTLRIILQNPRQLPFPRDHPSTIESEDAHLRATQLSASILLLPETNINWNNAALVARYKTHLNLVHQQSHLSVSSQSPTDNSPSHWLPGGTATITLGPWVARVRERISDPSGMGRWSGVTLIGRGKPLIVITCYRVPAASIASAGPLTSLARQHSHLSLHTRSTPDPRAQTLQDLSDFLQPLRSSAELLIGIDANEILTRHNSTHLPGSLSWFIHTLQLWDVHGHAYPHGLPTCQKSSKGPIDFILCSQSLRPAIKHSGYLPFDELFHSDHRPIYVDLCGTRLFQDTTHTIHRPAQRLLHSNNPRTTEAYLDQLCLQVATHRIYERLAELSTTFTTTPRTEHAPLISKYNSIDSQFGELLLASERTLGKPRAPGIPWSPALKQAARALTHAKRTYKTHPSAHNATIVQEAISHLKECRQRAQSLREEFLLERVAQHGRHMSIDHVRRSQIIHRIHASEQRRQQTKRLSSVLSKPRSALLSVQHDGRVVADPRQLEDLIIMRNAAHLAQARDTPLAQPSTLPLTNDPSHQTWQQLLQGSTVPPDARPILLTLQSILSTIPEAPETLPISTSEVRDMIKTIPERTSSSPSGRHLGHYKTALKEEALLQIITHLIAIPFQHGFAPDRWTTTVATMIEKEPGNNRLDKLRIIQLLEADFNIGLKIIWSHRLKPYLRSLHPSQYGCRVRLNAISPVLNKVITHDITRQSGSTGMFLECDATAAFDRVIPHVAALTSFAHGIPLLNCLCLLLTTIKMKHHPRTAYGTSEQFYCSTANQPLFGCGQGSGASPIIWLLTIDSVTRTCLADETCHLVSPTNSHQSARTFDTFVDDTAISVVVGSASARDQESPQDILHRTAQRFANVFHIVGGKLNPSKCHVTCLSSAATATTPTATPLHITDPSTGTSTSIPYLDSSSPYRTLGVYIAADGSPAHQLRILQGKINTFKARTYHMAPGDTYRGFKTWILPAIEYPLPALPARLYQLEALQSQLSTTIKHALGLCQHFPNHILHGPMDNGGLEVPHLPIRYAASILSRFLSHTRKQDTTGNLLLISLEWIQLHAGTASLFLHLPYNQFEHLRHPPNQWLHSLWEIASNYHITFTGITTFPPPPRERDAFLMNTLPPSLTTTQLRAFNHCRLFVRALYISDITHLDGRTIDFSRTPRPSHYRWPSLDDPSNGAWELWESVIRHTLCAHRTHALRQPLGLWLHPTHRIWEPSHISAQPSCRPNTRSRSHHPSPPTFTTTPADPPHAWSAFIGLCPIQHRHPRAIETQLRQHLFGDPTDTHCATALQRFLKRQPLHGRVRIAKILHGWLPTNCQQHRYNPVHPATCPFCPEEETQSHVYQCPNERASGVRNQAFDTFRQSIKASRIPSQLATLLHHALRHACAPGLQNAPTPYDYPQYGAFISHQEVLGWDQLPRLHVHSVLTSALPPRQSTAIYSALFSFHTRVWDHRNEQVHNSLPSNQLFHRQLLEHRLREWYDKAGTLTASGRALLETPLEVRLKLTDRALHYFIERLAASHTRWLRLTHSSDIRKYFSVVHRSPVARQQPSSPTRSPGITLPDPPPRHMRDIRSYFTRGS